LEAADAQGCVRRRVRLRASGRRAPAQAALRLPRDLTDDDLTSAVLILLAMLLGLQANPILTGSEAE
jgi:hypothetical protein